MFSSSLTTGFSYPVRTVAFCFSSFLLLSTTSHGGVQRGIVIRNTALPTLSPLQAFPESKGSAS